ncbi:DUF898 family protein [Thetidibacter halocola]|uniref:DUF898 family protein n=1 Tax=Thetidibacter halocola TaxID=2827239 RepID=A0A8J7WGV4_9RHOB|nr:DUF898 family protein [Thetidibacter halocola]MBS0124779.1 DUF898 family protein [Thetidibacter halocola]
MQDRPRNPWARASGTVETAPADEPVKPADPSAPAQDTLQGAFVGRGRPLFWLALRTGGLTVLTLGFYRFWMKTRLRRWYWSSIRIGGVPLEYVGDPLEKLLGFLFAVVILAFYIGVVNLLLMFASFALLQGNVAAYLLSFVGVIPLWFYAQYRARRYVLARTRWRGLRFGLEPGAWGYAARALGHWLLTLLSLGLLWPRMTFKLEQYRTDRTFFGDRRLHQGGGWTMLFPALKWIALALLLGLVATGALGSGAGGLSFLLFLLAGILMLYGLAYYRVETLVRLTATKTLDGVGLRLAASPRKVLRIHLVGYLLSGLGIALPASVLGALFVFVQSAETLADMGLDSLPWAGLDRWVLVLLGVALYFSIFLIWSALTHALITMPLTRHYAQGLQLTGSGGLAAIRQRPRDEHIEAEGFAEALDVGASL